MEGTLLQAYEEVMDVQIEALEIALQQVLDEAHVQIKAADAVNDPITAKDMLERHTRAAKILNTIKSI